MRRDYWVRIVCLSNLLFMLVVQLKFFRFVNMWTISPNFPQDTINMTTTQQYVLMFVLSYRNTSCFKSICI